MRSVGIGFCILVARIALIVFFDSLADPAVGVAAVAALLAGIIWLPNERRPAMAARPPGYIVNDPIGHLLDAEPSEG
jgi:hypothetical protein